MEKIDSKKKSKIFIFVLLASVSLAKNIGSYRYGVYNDPSTIKVFFISDYKLKNINFFDPLKSKNQISEVQGIDKCISVALL